MKHVINPVVKIKPVTFGFVPNDGSTSGIYTSKKHMENTIKSGEYENWYGFTYDDIMKIVMTTMEQTSPISKELRDGVALEIIKNHISFGYGS